MKLQQFVLRIPGSTWLHAIAIGVYLYLVTVAIYFLSTRQCHEDARNISTMGMFLPSMTTFLGPHKVLDWIMFVACLILACIADSSPFVVVVICLYTIVWWQYSRTLSGAWVITSFDFGIFAVLVAIFNTTTSTLHDCLSSPTSPDYSIQLLRIVLTGRVLALVLTGQGRDKRTDTAPDVFTDNSAREALSHWQVYSTVALMVASDATVVIRSLWGAWNPAMLDSQTLFIIVETLYLVFLATFSFLTVPFIAKPKDPSSPPSADDPLLRRDSASDELARMADDGPPN